MQLIAHSVVPSNPMPYMHLGYTSAMTSERSYRDIGLLFSIILIAFGLLMAIGRVRQLRKLLIGLLIATCGFGALALTRTFLDNGPKRYLHPSSVTKVNMYYIQVAIDSRLQEGGSVPGDLREIKADITQLLPTDPSHADHFFEDGWMHPIVLRRGSDSAIPYELVSAGPDGKFGTQDDIQVNGINAGMESP